MALNRIQINEADAQAFSAGSSSMQTKEGFARMLSTYERMGLVVAQTMLVMTQDG